MVSNESELKADVRQMTGYTSTLALSEDGLDTSFRTAKRHIRVKKSLGTDIDWFNADNPERQEALFWFTCLHTKVQTGELDAQDFQAGAVNQSSLLAKEDNDVTTWYRNAQGALESINGSSIIRSVAPSRTEREYTTDTCSTGNDSGGGGGGGADGSSDVSL